jgi:hypothetical protein
MGAALVCVTGGSLHGSDSLIDSYNSSNGAYGNSNVFNHGDVIARQTIWLNSNAIVNGQRYENTLTGITPVPTPSGSLINLGTLLVGSGETRSLAAGNYKATDITINSNGVLKAAGPVRIWYSGSLNQSGQVYATNKKPKDFWLFGTSSASMVNLNSGSQTWAVLHAPMAQANTYAPFYGAIVCANANVNSGTRLHYDEALGCAAALPGGNIVWWEWLTLASLVGKGVAQ